MCYIWFSSKIFLNFGLVWPRGRILFWNLALFEPFTTRSALSYYVFVLMLLISKNVRVVKGFKPELSPGKCYATAQHGNLNLIQTAVLCSRIALPWWQLCFKRQISKQNSASRPYEAKISIFFAKLPNVTHFATIWHFKWLWNRFFSRFNLEKKKNVDT